MKKIFIGGNLVRKIVGLGILFFSILFINLPTSYATNTGDAVLGGQFSSPPRILIYKVPMYPREAELYHLSGSVVLKVKVLSDGSIGNIIIVGSSGYKLLDQAVLDATKTWRYAPAIDKDGVPIQVYVLHRFSFGQPNDTYGIVKSAIDSWDPERLDTYSNPAVYNYFINQIYTQLNQFDFENIDTSYRTMISSIEVVDQKKKYDVNIYKAIARKIIKKNYPAKDVAQQWYQSAKELESRYKYEEAIPDYDRAISLEPYDVDYYSSRAFAYFCIHDYLGAICDYSEAIKLAPNNYKNYNQRGFNYYMVADYQNAISDYNKAIELKPNNADNFYDRGRVFRSLKEYKKAIDDYSRAIAINPGNDQYYADRGEAYHAVKKYQEALNDYSMAIQIAPNAPLIESIYYARGETYLALRDYRNALDSYNNAIAKFSGRADYYDGRGKVYLNLKEYQKAIDNFSQAINKLANNPKNNHRKAVYYLNRAEAFQKMGSNNEAVKDREEANRLKLDKE